MTNQDRSLHPFIDRLFQPIDIAILVYARLVFGGVLIWWAINYFVKGWIYEYYIAPGFWFNYPGLEWLTPWPGDGMYLHFGAIIVLSTLVVLGLFYRVSMTLLFLALSYVFLLDQAHYLNHHYLVALYCFIMIWVPAHRGFSLDALMRRKLRVQTAPSWTLWLMRFQMGIVYFFGGISKINPDWLHGEPMRMILADRTDFPIIGQWFTEEWMVMAFAYGGMVFDLSIVFLLLWKPTRWFGFAWAVSFHILNANLFSIGIFPWLSLALTLLYFPPDWPRHVLRVLKIKLPKSDVASTRIRLRPWQWVGVTFWTVYVIVQLVLPFRHHLYEGNVYWTGEGEKFTWSMIVHNKAGEGTMRVNDADAHVVMAGMMRSLNQRQVEFMLTHPHLLHLFAVYVGERLEEHDYYDGVRVDVKVSLNGRKPQLIVDPDINLDQQPLYVMPAKWIMPLTEPLPSPEERPKRYWLNAYVHSTASPPIKIKVLENFELLDELRFSAGGLINVDTFVFVDRSDQSVERLLVVQFEGYVEGETGNFSPPTSSPQIKDQYEVYPTSNFAKAQSLSAQDITQIVLQQHELELWEDFMIQRVELPYGDERRHRLVISYFEDVNATGYSAHTLAAEERMLWKQEVGPAFFKRALSVFVLQER